MSLYWYPTTSTGRKWAELIVDEPGYGRLTLRRLDDHYETDPDDEVGTYAGRELGELLRKVTNLALGTFTDAAVQVDASRGESVTIDRRDAAGFLPMLQQAVVAAAAGDERYHRLWNDGGRQPEPLCVVCDEGADFTKNLSPSPWCAEHGHEPFGVQALKTWDAAHADHQREASWHELRR